MAKKRKLPRALEYELTTRTYLALFLDSVSIEDLLNRINEDLASEVLAAIAALTYGVETK
jgi:hypothetical protein